MNTRERQFRGISRRAAVGYLEGLGGERVEEGVVEGDGWRASISPDTVTIGPTLEISELTIQFEGEPATLDDLIESFSRKALRAGG